MFFCHKVLLFIGFIKLNNNNVIWNKSICPEYSKNQIEFSNNVLKEYPQIVRPLWIAFCINTGSANSEECKSFSTLPPIMTFAS